MNQIIKDISDIHKSNLDFSDFVSNKSILILGANSFILSYLILFIFNLKNVKYSLILCTRNKKTFLNKIKKFNFNNNKNITFINYHNLKKFDKRIDIIIHASSPASPSLYNKFSNDLYKTNVIYLYYLLNLVKIYKPKIIFISSGEVYGNFNSNKILKSNQTLYSFPFTQRSLYSDSKRLSESILYSWSNNYGIDVSIIRLFHTYGPFIDINDGRIFSLIIKNLLENKKIHFNDPFSKRCYCYISDFTDALIKMILNMNNFQIHNCANINEEFNAFGLSKILKKEFFDLNISFSFNEIVKKNKYKIIRARPDISSLKKVGWKPKVSVDIGFRNTYNFYKY